MGALGPVILVPSTLISKSLPPPLQEPSGNYFLLGLQFLHRKRECNCASHRFANQGTSDHGTQELCVGPLCTSKDVPSTTSTYYMLIAPPSVSQYLTLLRSLREIKMFEICQDPDYHECFGPREKLQL